MDPSVLERRLRAVEKHNRILASIVLVMLAGLVALALVAWRADKVQAAEKEPSTLRVRELVVVDDHGVERIRLGAPLPEPIAGGKRGRRNGTVAGMMLYDADGDERGGYVTDETNNAFLSLDSKTGQVVTLVAYPQEGAQLGLQTPNGATQVAVSAVSKGPSVKLLVKHATIAHLP